MYIDNILFWSTVLSGIIIGLVVGLILGYVGYCFWKRQNNYSKGQDAHNSLVNSLSVFISYITILYSDKDSLNDLYFRKEITEFAITLLHNTNNFTFYFGENYNQLVLDIIEKYRKIRNKEDIGMNETELNAYLLEKKSIIIKAKKI